MPILTHAQAVNQIDEWRNRLFALIEDPDYQEAFQDGPSLLDQLTHLHDEMAKMLEGHHPKGCCAE